MVGIILPMTGTMVGDAGQRELFGLISKFFHTQCEWIKVMYTENILV